MNSLGREPQVQGNQKTKSPGGAADSVCSVSCSHIRTFFCRRSAAGFLGNGMRPGAHAPGYSSVAAPRLTALAFCTWQKTCS